MTILYYIISEFGLILKRWRQIVLLSFFFFSTMSFIYIVSNPFFEKENISYSYKIYSIIFLVFFLFFNIFLTYIRTINNINNEILYKVILPITKKTIIIVDFFEKILFSCIVFFISFVICKFFIRIDYNILFCGLIGIFITTVSVHSFLISVYITKNIYFLKITVLFFIYMFLFLLISDALNINFFSRFLFLALYCIFIVIFYLISSIFMFNKARL